MANNQTRKTASGAAADGAGETTAGLTAAAGTLAEIQRQQLAAGAEALSTLFRAGEAIQQVQMQMGQRAALLHSQAADNIRKATSPMELVTIQSTLAMYEWQEALRYSQELVAAFAKSSGEMLRPTQAENGATASSPASTVMGAAMGAAAPMADVFQQMFTAPMKAAAQASQATH